MEQISFVGKARNLMDYIDGLVAVEECSHDCTSECRRSGCECDCGEYHLTLSEAITELY